MSAEQFKVGDVVELKSGSPGMTVVEVNDDGDTKCTWFKAGIVQEARFPQDALKPVAA